MLILHGNKGFIKISLERGYGLIDVAVRALHVMMNVYHVKGAAGAVGNKRFQIGEAHGCATVGDCWGGD